MLQRGDGPIPARVLIVGEAFGEFEERSGRPFEGPSGQELNRMLHEAGIMRSECFVTNLINARPPNNDINAWIAKAKKDITPAHRPLRGKMVLPIVQQGYDQLLSEIKMVRPVVIIALGNSAMWALTGLWGIIKWRGSMLEFPLYADKTNLVFDKIPVIPSYHPAAILREWSWRAIAISDLRRAKKILVEGPKPQPPWNFRIRPSFDDVARKLVNLQLSLDSGVGWWLDFDIETNRYTQQILCVGISWSRLDALCIPFVAAGKAYWTEEEEAEIVYMLYRILTHPRVKIRWQNGLFDAQIVYRHWHFIPRGAQDTMISQHTMFAQLPKALGFLGSMYCDFYVFWKEEGKSNDPSVPEDAGWVYNLKDCVYTREVGEVQLETVKKLNLEAVHDFQQALFWPVLRAMNLGVRIVQANKTALANEIQGEISRREEFIFNLLGHQLNINSHPQMTKLFYEDLKQPPVMTRAAKGIPGHLTCDDEALQKISAREPLLKPLINAISDLRTLGIFNNFVLMRLDFDGRARCSFNIGGSTSGKSAPYSYRLSSSKNPWDGGANLQTIPSDKSKSLGKAAARGQTVSLPEFHLPNIRSMFGPDPGFTFFDGDLDRADLQVVVWESNDEMLKAALRLGSDIHTLNAFVLEGKDPPPLEELVETHPRYLDHRGPRKHLREFAKVFCHATNYVGGARTVAAHTGRTVNEIDRAQKIWFGAHPGIKAWHSRVEEQVRKFHFVENRFGYKWHIFDRIEGILPEACAWVPQSTVGCTVNRIWKNIYDNYRWIHVLLQVHDSLAGQFPSHRRQEALTALQEASKVVIPYEDPLIIPFGVKTSEVSWGECL